MTFFWSSWGKSHAWWDHYAAKHDDDGKKDKDDAGCGGKDDKPGASDPVCETVTTVLLHEDFNHMSKVWEEGTFERSHWDARWNAAVAGKCDDGPLKTTEIDVSGQDSLHIAFEAKGYLSDRCADFEQQGRHGEDSLSVSLVVNGDQTIDLGTFYYVGHGRFETEDGEHSFKVGEYGEIAFDVDLPEGAETAQLVFDATVTANNEFFKIDDVKITGKAVCETCPEDADKIGFDLPAGTLVDSQFGDCVTISAFANIKPKVICIEAEDMCDSGFKDVWSHTGSGHEIVKLKGHSGWLKETIRHTGTFEVAITLQDESDGVSKLYVTIGDNETVELLLDGNGDGHGSDHGPFSTVNLGAFDIEKGEEIRIEAVKGGHEFVRIDKITLTQVVDPTENRAMVFDSDNPTGGDHDLGVKQGGVLIISEDGNSADPDDNARGGTFHFDFTDPATLYSIDVIDTEEGGEITLFLEDGSTKVIALPHLRDGEVQTVDLGDTGGVTKMTVKLNGSGALDNLCYECADTPPPNEHPIAVDDAFCFCVDPDDLVAGDGEMWNVLDANGTQDADSDPEGDALTTTLVGDDDNEGSVTLASGAVVTLAADGSLSIDVSGAVYGGTPASELPIGQTVTETVDYVLSDGTSTDTGTVSIEVKGADATIEAVKALLPDSAELSVGIAGDPLNLRWTSEVVSTLPELSGMFTETYCINFGEPIGTLPNPNRPDGTSGFVDADVYIAAEGHVPDGVLGGMAAGNLDSINWILNQRFVDNGVYTAVEVQAAIWELTDGFAFIESRLIGDQDTTTISSNAAQIVDAATTVGEGFNPEDVEDAIFGVVLDPTGETDSGFSQPFIVGIEFECVC